MSVPQYVNGAASVHLFCGRSTIFWYPIFPRSLRRVMHLCIRCWIITLAFTINMHLCLRWFKVIPLGPWATLWWLHCMIILETTHFFGRMTGWFSASVKFDFLNLPSIRKMRLLSRNRSNWLILLLSGTIFFSDFSCFISLANDLACTKRKIFSWAFCFLNLIISVSMLSFC